MMEPTYTAIKQQLIKRYENMRIDPSIPDLWRHFVFFAANCRHFLEIDTLQAQKSLFARICLNQQLSVWEDKHRDLLPADAVGEIDGSWWQALRSRPGIICTFHTGSYRLINHLLMKQGIAYALLVSEKVRNRDGADFEKRYHKGSKGSDQLMVLHAEDPAVLFKIRHLLQAGKSLLAYVDGNTGSGRQGIPVSFFNREIQVRKGLPVLAHLLQVPLYPIANIRKGGQLVFLAPDPIWASPSIERHAFAHQSMQELYRFLEQLIEPAADQWAGWLHLHHATSLPRGKEGSFCVGLNGCPEYSDTLLPFLIDGKAFVFNPINYRAYSIPLSLYERMLNNLR